jgi:2-C-methyl-D-erythritol 4-phosphate cytidylyltransferase
VIVSSEPPRTFAVVPCAGVGQRAVGAGVQGPKQYQHVAGRTVVAHTLHALLAVREIAAVLVVLAPDDQGFAAAVAGEDLSAERLWTSRRGGATRAASVMAGLVALGERGAAAHDAVLVHDAARCLLRPVWVQRLIEACRDDEIGGLLALPLADTLKQEMPEAPGRAAATLDRRQKWAAQTPQMFRLGLLQAALRHAGDTVTDEASAVEQLGHAPLLVPGALENFKLTWPEDFALAKRLLETR